MWLVGANLLLAVDAIGHRETLSLVPTPVMSRWGSPNFAVGDRPCCLGQGKDGIVKKSKQN